MCVCAKLCVCVCVCVQVLNIHSFLLTINTPKLKKENVLEYTQLIDNKHLYQMYMRTENCFI